MAEEEPVAFHEPFELDGDDTREGGTNEAVMNHDQWLALRDPH